MPTQTSVYGPKEKEEITVSSNQFENPNLAIGEVPTQGQRAPIGLEMNPVMGSPNESILAPSFITAPASETNKFFMKTPMVRQQG